MKKHTLIICLVSFATSLLAQSFSAGSNSSFAICSDSSVGAWGWGPLGDGTTNSSSSLVHVSSLSKIIAVNTGHGGSFAIRSDSTLWAWGQNSNGNLGDSTTTSRLSPVQVHGPGNIGFLTKIKEVSSGSDNFALALKYDSTVWAWGWGFYGQLGNNSRKNSLVPIKVNNLSGIVSVQGGGDFSIALKQDGTVWAWGYDQFGEMGDGTLGAPVCNCDSFPVQVHGPGNVGYLSGITAIAAGENHVLALKNDSTVWAWGNNTYGELGNGTQAYSGCFCELTPVKVSNLTKVVAIAAGSICSYAIKVDGTIWAWGGTLGNNTTANSNVPVQVHGPGNIGFLNNIVSVSARNSNVLAMEQNGNLWAWGSNQEGQLGNGTISTSGCYCDSTPTQVIHFPCTITSGINRANSEEAVISVYPNPAGSFLNVSLSPGTEQNTSIKIYNSLGEVLIAGEYLSNNKIEIDVSRLNSGLYLLEITLDNYSHTKRFLKL